MANQQFRDTFYQFVPPWLSTDNAERYMYVLELMRDLLCEKADEAQTIRLPGQGDPSQIPFLAHDRQLVQGPNEPNASFVERLKTAFATWATAGSAPAVLEQLEAYTQGFQLGAPAGNPAMRIVSNPRTLPDASQVNTWWTVFHHGSSPASFPSLATVPKDFDWNGITTPWWCWLVLYQYAVATGQSGTGGITTTAGGGSFVDPGHEVDGVWVPQTSGTPINAPFLTVSGLYGLTSANVGDVITISGSGNPGNNGTFQIVQVPTEFNCVVANPDGVTADAGPLTWSIARYGWIPPGLAWGAPGTVWGEGEDATPPVDTGANRQGTWQPTQLAGVGTSPSFSWGLRISALEIQTVRGLLKAWKSAGTYYPNIVVCYDGGDGTGDSAYSPTNDPDFNPNASFADVGKLVDGVWVPSRMITSPWNAYCQGTGQALACGVENIT